MKNMLVTSKNYMRTERLMTLIRNIQVSPRSGIMIFSRSNLGDLIKLMEVGGGMNI